MIILVKNKLIIAMLIIALLIQSITTFADVSFEQKLFDLEGLGIITGDENGDFHPEREVSRAEMAAIAVRLMGFTDITLDDGSQKYYDVPVSHWAYGYINLLSELGVVSGTSEGNFQPDRGVSFEESCKIFVNILGYEYAAKQNGGYPGGYVRQAYKLNLADGVNAKSGALTRKDTASMAYNALDVKLMTIDWSEKLSYSISGDTLRTNLEDHEYDKSVKYTGIVTATIDAYTDKPNPNITENDIEINGKLYRLKNKADRKYIGQWVDFYSYTNSADGKDYITMLSPNKNNFAVTFAADMVKSAASGTVVYYTDKDKRNTDTMQTKAGCVLIKNNTIKEVWNISELLAQKNGFVTMIDNNGDDIADVIIAKEYTSAVVEKTMDSNKTVLLGKHQTINGRRDIELLPDDDDIIVTITDADGNDVSPESVKEGAVLSVYVNDSMHRVEIMYSDKCVKGIVKEIGEDTVTLDETEYSLEDDALISDIKCGDEITAYINFNGEIMRIDDESSDLYGYILRIGKKKEFANYSAMVISPDVLAEREEVTENSDGSTTTKKILSCRNNELLQIEFADSVNIDGTKYTDTEAANTLFENVIAYKLNAEGKIYKVSTPQRLGGGTKKYYNSNEKTFGKGFGGAFGVNDKTYTICIPDPSVTPNPTDEDYLVDVEMNNGQEYTISAYDESETTHTAGVIVVTMPMVSGTPGTIRTTSDVGLVTRVKFIRPDGDTENDTVIDIMTKKGLRTLTVNRKINTYDSFANIKRGELIAFSCNARDELDAYESLGVMNTGTALGLENVYGDYEVFCGYVIDSDLDRVSEDLNRWVHMLYCSTDINTSAERIYEVKKNSGPPIIIYNTETQSAALAEAAQIRVKSDKIFVSASNGEVRAIVIIR